VVLRPDPRHRMPGRGAWLHPVPGCFEMAVRRKAFGRALRVRAAVDVSALAQHLELQHVQQKGAGPGPVAISQRSVKRTNKAG
jgi:predicted RNA-binding protein YlxR (DUF448 family)